MADRQLDRIGIHDLRVRCIVGINPEERETKQDVVIQLTLHADLKRAGETDCIEDTIDYMDLTDRVSMVVEGSTYYLIERLAERIAEVCLEEKAVQKIEVIVQKPGALRRARSVEVEIIRERG